jgi:hypothetical protein
MQWSYIVEVYGQKVTFQKAKVMMNVGNLDEEGEGVSLKKQTAAATGQADEYFWKSIDK